MISFLLQTYGPWLKALEGILCLSILVQRQTCEYKFIYYSSIRAMLYTNPLPWHVLFTINQTVLISKRIFLFLS